MAWTPIHRRSAAQRWAVAASFTGRHVEVLRDELRRGQDFDTVQGLLVGVAPPPTAATSDVLVLRPIRPIGAWDLRVIPLAQVHRIIDLEHAAQVAP